jgi:hypothetical protein
MIHALRRNGYTAADIVKLTGHSSVETLVKSYDHTLDDSEKVDMAATICFAPQLNRGEVNKVQGKIFF